MQMTLDITDGPSKADLLRSVTNLSEGLTITFETTGARWKSRLKVARKDPNGVDFVISGFATPSPSHLHFSGTYNIEEKAGRLNFDRLA